MAVVDKGRVKFEDVENVFGYLKGTTTWAQVLEVDLYGNYSVNIYGDAVLEMKEEIEAIISDASKEVTKLGKKYEEHNVAKALKVDDEGKEFIAFKLPPENWEKKEQHVVMYDAGGNKIDDWDELVGNGSTVKIKYMISPYYMASSKTVGVSFKFYAMQVIDLVEYKGKADSGFGDETGEKAPFDVEGDDF